MILTDNYSLRINVIRYELKKMSWSVKGVSSKTTYALKTKKIIGIIVEIWNLFIFLIKNITTV